MSVICIIPARGGSRRIKKKNIRSFHGKPIIAYSIESAKESGLFDEIWVSTEDREIADVAFQYGAKWHPRSKELAEDFVGTQEVMAGVVKELWPKTPPPFVCCLYPCSPLLIYTDLIRGMAALQWDYSMSVRAGTLEDAGNFYFGETSSFLNRVPLVWSVTTPVEITEERVCDINTPEDWDRAEQMYTSLQEKK